MPSATVPVNWDIQEAKVGSVTLPVVRLVVGLHFAPLVPGQKAVAEQCWLDTAAPLTVIPKYIHHGRMAWEPLGVTSKWMDVDCDIGGIDVWLPQQPEGFHGPFRLLAKFARSDLPGPHRPVLLGMEFVLAHRARLRIQPPPPKSTIRVP